MAVTLRTLSTNGSLAEHQTAVRQAEALGFRVRSLATGRVGGGRANLVTLVQEPGAPAAPIILEIIGGGLTQDAQEEILNTGGRQLVCYGSLAIVGEAENVVAWRG